MPLPTEIGAQSQIRLTWKPRGVDVVGVVPVGARRQVDPRGVGGEQVGRAILALVADEQGRGVLRLGRVIRRHDLQGGERETSLYFCHDCRLEKTFSQEFNALPFLLT